MITTDLTEQQEIVNLFNKGIGKKKIARMLGTTEWKVRTTIRTSQTRLLQNKSSKTEVSGKIRLAKPKKKDIKPIKALILSDIHIPYHDPVALALALEYAKDYEPDHIVLNGDIVDFYGASAYRKDPLRINTLQDELDETVAFLRLLRSQHTDAKIDYVMGNHEDRIQRFLIDKAPELCSFDCLALDELLKLKELDIRFVDSKSTISLGELEVTHGTIVRKWSGSSGKAHHEKFGGSVLIGHVHRLGTFYRTNRWGTHIAIENGFLGRNDFEYVDRPDWQHGFTAIEYLTDGTFTIRQHHIQNGILIVDNVKYEV